jgi:hypothetical protein
MIVKTWNGALRGLVDFRAGWRVPMSMHWIIPQPPSANEMDYPWIHFPNPQVQMKWTIMCGSGSMDPLPQPPSGNEMLYPCVDQDPWIHLWVYIISLMCPSAL